jgi:hypothetical protein
VLCALPVSSSLTWSFWLYLEKNTSYETSLGYDRLFVFVSLYRGYVDSCIRIVGLEVFQCFRITVSSVSLLYCLSEMSVSFFWNTVADLFFSFPMFPQLQLTHSTITVSYDFCWTPYLYYYYYYCCLSVGCQSLCFI